MSAEIRNWRYELLSVSTSLTTTVANSNVRQQIRWFRGVSTFSLDNASNIRLCAISSFVLFLLCPASACAPHVRSLHSSPIQSTANKAWRHRNAYGAKFEPSPSLTSTRCSRSRKWYQVRTLTSAFTSSSFFPWGFGPRAANACWSLFNSSIPSASDGNEVKKWDAN